MPTRYLNEAPMNVFRIHFDPRPRVELYDVGVHAWRPRPLEPLYPRAGILDGEVGVDEISAGEVAPLIAELEFGRGAGRRREPDRLRLPSARETLDLSEAR